MKTYHFINALALICSLASCAGFKSVSAPHRFVGHWRVGAPFSEFATLDGKQAFYIFDDDMPPSAHTFLDTQPTHRDFSSESGDSVSAYFEVTGRLIPYKNGFADAPTYQRLHVVKILRMEPTKADYVASLVKQTH